MGYFLIDFENVHDVGLNGVTSLTENDEVCIFYSAKSEHMSFETHVNIMKTPAKVKYIKLRKSARNYLDFQLVTHLGYLVGSNAPGPYYIISKDTGYDSAIDYWRDHGVTIIRQPSVSYNSRQGRFPGQQSGQITPAALVTIQECHQVISENAAVTLDVIPVNTELEVKPEESQIDVQEPVTEIMTKPADESPSEAGEIETPDIKEDEPAAESIVSSPEEAVQSEEPQPRKNTRRRGNQKKQQNNSKSRKSQAKDNPAASQENQPVTDEKAKATDTTIQEDAPAQDPVDDVPVQETVQTADTPQSSHSPEFSEEQSAEKAQSLPEAFRKKVRTALRGKEIPSAHYASIYKAIMHSYDKLALNNLMVKTFGSSKGGVVYNQIKDIFTDFHQQGQ